MWSQSDVHAMRLRAVTGFGILLSRFSAALSISTRFRWAEPARPSGAHAEARSSERREKVADQCSTMG